MNPWRHKSRLAVVSVAMAAGFPAFALSTTGENTPAQKEIKIMLMIDEKNLGTVATAEVESFAAKSFMEQGVQIVDQEMVRANIKKDQQLLKMSGDNRGAATVGLQFGADIIVVGDAVAKPAAQRIADSQLRTYQASVTLRAVRTDTSETIAFASETGTAIAMDDVTGGSKALKAAGQKAIQPLVAAVLEKTGLGDPDDGSQRQIEMIFGGVDQSWKVKVIRKILEKRPDLTHVAQKTYTSGSVQFEAMATVPARKLSEALVLDPPNGLKLQVLEVSRGKISMRAVTLD